MSHHVFFNGIEKNNDVTLPFQIEIRKAQGERGLSIIIKTMVCESIFQIRNTH